MIRGLLAALLLWTVSSQSLWAQEYDTTTAVRPVRIGFFPTVVLPGETFAFRVDYHAGSAVDTVYIPADFDWSPFELVGYRYIRAVEDGSRSLQVILRVPEGYTTTPNDWSTSIRKQPPLRWRLRNGEEREEIDWLFSVVVRTRHIHFTSPDGSGFVYDDRPVGSWYLANVHGSIRDNTTLPIARGSGYIIVGLSTDLVNMALLYWRNGIFKVWIEGPFFLYRINPSSDSTDFYAGPNFSFFYEKEYLKFTSISDTFKTDIIPYYWPSDNPNFIENTWRLFVIPKPEAQNGSRGKVVAAFYQEGVELFRRELYFYVYGDLLKNNINLTPIFNNISTSFDISNFDPLNWCYGYSRISEICRLGLSPDPIIDYYYSYLNSGYLSINYEYNSYGFIDAKIFSSFTYDRKFLSLVKNEYRYPSRSFEEVKESIESSIEQGWYRCYFPYCYSYRDTIANKVFYSIYVPELINSNEQREHFYSVFRQNSDIIFDLGFYPYNPRAIYISKSDFLGQLNYSSLPTGSPGYEINCVHDSTGVGCHLVKTYDLQPVNIAYSYKQKKNLIFVDDYFYDIFYSREIFNLPPDLNNPPPEDTLSEPVITIRLLANPSAQRLQDLEVPMAQRRPFEFLVQAEQEGQPLAGAPVSVEGPFAADEIPSSEALLFLNNPQQTDALGFYSFYWIPPSRAWFEGKSLPYRFRFRVHVGDRWEDVTVQVSNLIIQGQVLQRHAGAKLQQDPDRDGLLPVANVEVSLEPDFPAERSVRTDLNGRFELGVSEPGSYTVYARRQELWPDNFPKWSRTQGRVRITESGPVPDTLRLILAELPVGAMRQRWIPAIAFDMESVRDTLQHLRIIPELQAFLWQIAEQDSTGALDEEAVRRLQQAVFAAYDLFQGAHDLATCGTTAIWDGSLGIILEIVKTVIEKTKLLENISRNIRSKLPVDWKQSPDPKIRQLGRTLEALEDIKTKFAHLLKNIESWSKKMSLDLKEGMKTAAVKGEIKTLFTMNFLVEKAFDPLSQLTSYVANLAEKTKLDDLTKDLAFSQTLEQTGINRLLASLNDTIKDLLKRGQLDDLRATVATTLHQEIGLAQQRQFPAYPLSFYHARHASNGWLKLMREERSRRLGFCEGLLGFKEQVDAALEALNVAMVGLAVATSGALAAWVVATDAVSKVVGLALNAAMVRTGIEVMTAIQPEGSYGRLGIAAMRKAFSLKVPVLAMRVHSPVRLMVVDALGRRVGADATGQIYNEIPGAGYWPASDSLQETVVLPADIGPFQTILHGTGSGAFALDLVQLDTLGNETLLRRWEGQATPQDRWQLVVATPEQAVATGTLQSLPAPTALFVQQNGQSRDTILVPLTVSVPLEAVFQYDTTLTLPATAVQWAVSDTLAAIETTAQPSQASVIGLYPGSTTLTVQSGALTRQVVLEVIGLKAAITLGRRILSAPDTASVQVQVDAHGVALPEQLALRVFTPAGRYQMPVLLDDLGRATVRWHVPDSLAGRSGPGLMELIGVTASDTVSLAWATFVLATATEVPEVLEAEAVQDGAVVARLRVARTLLAGALQPEILLAVEDSLPAPLPPGFVAIGPVIGWSFWDQAQGTAVAPSAAYRLQLWSGAYQGTPVAFYWNGPSWEVLEVEPVSGSWEATLESAGGVILLARQEQVVPVEKTELPEQVVLEAYPNPFGARMQIRMGVPRPGPVRLTLYDVLGREVLCLYEGEQAAGWHNQAWDVSQLASGLYLLVLEGEGFRTTKTMVKVR